jgi:hypothetical protein
MKLILTTALIMISTLCNGVNCTSINTGLWSSPSTWSCGRVPQNNDTIIISLSDTVTVDCNCGVYDNMVIGIYGNLYFSVGQKISLDANGVVQIYTGGMVSGGNGGSKILIDGQDKWNGSDGPISGPAYTCDTCPPLISAPLPIELVFFTTKLTKYNHVQLEWLTQTEINNDYFEVLVMRDDITWELLTTVQGHGNSNSPILYNVTDDNPSVGHNYYKLIQYDFDGKSTTHKIVVIDVITETDKDIHIWPNPSNSGDDINVELTGFQKETTLIVVMNPNGQIFYEKAILSVENNLIFVIDSELKTGTYIIVGSNKHELYRRRLVVK